ncbi:MAG: ABC transporter permease [Candidatus Promineifilaceae bacterium]
MTVATPPLVKDTTPKKAKSPTAEVWDNLRRSTSGMIGLSLIIGHLLLALSAPFITPKDPFRMDAPNRRIMPTSEFWFGTDETGRDIFSRSMMGGRTLITVTIIGTFMAMSWGGFVGILLGFVGGRVDDIAMRLVDAFLAIPWLLFLLLIVSVVGTEPWVQALTFGFFYGIPVIRVARAATHDYVTREFILAARARGESKRDVVIKELLPNVMDIMLVEGAMRWSWMLLAFTSLSYLGFGVAPPAVDWGRMISDSRKILALQPWATFGPVLMLSSLIIGLNLFADALAKALGLDRSQGAPL